MLDPATESGARRRGPPRGLWRERLVEHRGVEVLGVGRDLSVPGWIGDVGLSYALPVNVTIAWPVYFAINASGSSRNSKIGIGERQIREHGEEGPMAVSKLAKSVYRFPRKGNSWHRHERRRPRSPASTRTRWHGRSSDESFGRSLFARLARAPTVAIATPNAAAAIPDHRTAGTSAGHGSGLRPGRTGSCVALLDADGHDSSPRLLSLSECMTTTSIGLIDRNAPCVSTCSKSKS